MGTLYLGTISSTFLVLSPYVSLGSAKDNGSSVVLTTSYPNYILLAPPSSSTYVTQIRAGSYTYNITDLTRPHLLLIPVVTQIAYTLNNQPEQYIQATSQSSFSAGIDFIACLFFSLQYIGGNYYPSYIVITCVDGNEVIYNSIGGPGSNGYPIQTLLMELCGVPASPGVVLFTDGSQGTININRVPNSGIGSTITLTSPQVVTDTGPPPKSPLLVPAFYTDQYQTGSTIVTSNLPAPFQDLTLRINTTQNQKTPCAVPNVIYGNSVTTSPFSIYTL